VTPEKLGPYRVLGPLGAGGMGVVYKALSAETGERVAIKTVRVPRQGLIAAIRREIRALMRVRHPGVVRVLAEGVDGGLPWYAMELLEGGTLRDHHQAIWKYVHDGSSTQQATKGGKLFPTTLIERVRSSHPHAEVSGLEGPPAAQLNGNGHGGLAGGSGNGNGNGGHITGSGLRIALPRPGGGHLADALRPIARLCRTLAFLHGEGIVHRDLKPENVFIRPGGFPVLMDFGIVAHFGGAFGREVLEVVGVLSGTAGYMAPEQIQGERVDARADLYAVGCLLYELCTGLSAFGGETQEVLGHHLRSEPVPPHELVDHLPPALNELILRLMAKRPRNRIGHADDVAAALEEWTGPSDPPSETPAVPTRAYLYRPELVGREEVRERLTDKLTAADAGVGGCVYLGGESGVGKTALAGELTRIAAQRGMQVLAGECFSLAGAASAVEGVGGPLHPFRPMLQAVADRCMERGAETTGRLLGGRGQVLAAIEPSLERVTSELPRLAELPAEAARRRLLQTLAYTISQLAEDKPLVLVIDDLQWADELTLDFLGSLEPSWFAGKRLLIVATYRSDEISPPLSAALASPVADKIELPRLDARTVEAMVGDMLALAAPPTEFVDYLAGASEGNPFFVAEYLRAAVAEGLLTRDLGGHWRFQRASVGADEGLRLALPRGLRDLVNQRLSGLPELARRIVLGGSVLGREFEADLLLDVAGLTEADEGASHALSDLLVRHVLEPDGARLRFVHDKLREVAYERLGEPERRALHGAAARAIQARSQGSPQHFAELAHHFQVAGELGAALDYLEKSGDHALHTSAHAAAADAFTRALALDVEQGFTVDARRRARWEHGLSKAQFASGDLILAETHARAALAHLGKPLPSSRLGWGALLVGEALRQTWRLFGPERGDDELPQAVKESLSEAAHAASLMTHRFYYVGDSAAMIGASLFSVNLAERVDVGWQVPRSYSWLGYVVGLMRRHSLAARYFARAHEGAERLDDPSELAFALTVESVYHIGFAAWEAAEERIRRALELCDSDVQMRELVLTTLGHIEYFTARFEESRRRFSSLLASARARHNEQHITWALFSMGRALSAQERHAEALPLLEEARQRLEKHSELDSEIICLGLLAQAHWHRGDFPAARRLADETLARVRRSRPASFAVVTGYDAAIEVFLELWSARGQVADEALKRGAVDLVTRLGKLAKLFPMVGPLAALQAGRVEEIRGRSRRAARRFEEAARLAAELQMPREAARAAAARARSSS
jgi:serine/threonine protein kinase/tetratricopeptide (TPR) repeat protein